METSEILSKWSSVNLPSLQTLLDSQSLSIFSSQQSSQTSRKKLLTLTKEFKRLPSPDLNDFKGLLKEYQSEIDLVTKRSKAAEQMFIEIYKILVELPDPVICIEKLKVLEEERKVVEGVGRENEELKRVVGELKRQVEGMRGEVEGSEEMKEKLKDFQSMMDNMVTEKAQDLVQVMKLEMEERIQTHKETEYALTRQVNNLKDQFEALKTSREFDNAVSGGDKGIFNNRAEVEVLMNEIEKCNEKMGVLATENFGLRERVKELSKESEMKMVMEKFEEERKELESKVLVLKNTLEESQKNTKSLIDQHKSQIQILDRQVAKSNTEIARLSTLLLEYSDYEQVKKELEIFKNMEGDYSGDNVPLEIMVLEKNKKLENENTSLKNECEELKEELATTTTKITAITDILTTKTNLITKLEKDIQQLNDLRGNTSPSENLEMLMSPVKSSDSIVHILTSQRDRYRQRFEQAQRNIQELSTKLTTTQDQLSRLQQDNVSLYEKLRYQESYRGTTAVSMGDEVSTRYRDKYESTIDPFRQFKQDENRRASNLSPTDRLAMQVTKILTANKYTRLVFVIYAGLLHILVFVALFEMMASPPTSPHLPFPNKPDS